MARVRKAVHASALRAANRPPLLTQRRGTAGRRSSERDIAPQQHQQPGDQSPSGAAARGQEAEHDGDAQRRTRWCSHAQAATQPVKPKSAAAPHDERFVRAQQLLASCNHEPGPHHAARDAGAQAEAPPQLVAVAGETPPSFRVRSHHLPANVCVIPEDPGSHLLPDAALHALVASHDARSPVASHSAHLQAQPPPAALTPPPHWRAASTLEATPTASPGRFGAAGASAPPRAALRYSAVSGSSASRSPEPRAPVASNAAAQIQEERIDAPCSGRTSGASQHSVTAVSLDGSPAGADAAAATPRTQAQIRCSATIAGHDEDDMVRTAQESVSPERRRTARTDRCARAESLHRQMYTRRAGVHSAADASGREEVANGRGQGGIAASQAEAARAQSELPPWLQPQHEPAHASPRAGTPVLTASADSESHATEHSAHAGVLGSVCSGDDV